MELTATMAEGDLKMIQGQTADDFEQVVKEAKADIVVIDAKVDKIDGVLKDKITSFIDEAKSTIDEIKKKVPEVVHTVYDKLKAVVDKIGELVHSIINACQHKCLWVSWVVTVLFSRTASYRCSPPAHFFHDCSSVAVPVREVVGVPLLRGSPEADLREEKLGSRVGEQEEAEKVSLPQAFVKKEEEEEEEPTLPLKGGETALKEQIAFLDTAMHTSFILFNSLTGGLLVSGLTGGLLVIDFLSYPAAIPLTAGVALERHPQGPSGRREERQTVVRCGSWAVDLLQLHQEETVSGLTGGLLVSGLTGGLLVSIVD
ncbi:hypothetical protein JRQ81_011569 [Phrynocephalus forsythii]|uniref:Uncharacterized protein n=1 Tax=Phrynocephalus forsythii TaxID=171643 RepID=A0A9Q1AQA9_9SAUR|nr:hypothetical protein JRQ81_011569 [Phrynocephalus forsythii]